jgi:hypothetical protein
LLLVPLTAPAGRADIVPLRDLSQGLIRARVRSFLPQPEAQKLLAPISAFVLLDADQITYEAANGEPTRLVWAYQPTQELDAVRRQAVERILMGVLREVFGNYMGGLLSDADAARVLNSRVTRITAAAPQPPPRMERLPEPVPVSVIYCYPYGCCYGPVPVVMYSSPAAAGRPQPVVRRTTPPEVPRNLDGPSLYVRAVRYYWQDDPEAALTFLNRAIELSPKDARFWYFKALAERQLGRTEAARTSARRGAGLQLARRTSLEAIGLALERVQGADRQFLREASDAPIMPGPVGPSEAPSGS